MNINEATLKRIREIYLENNIKSGVLKKVCIRPGWFLIYGSNNECGISLNFTGDFALYDKINIDTKIIKDLIHKDLFDIAERLIKSDTNWIQSFLIAILNALSSKINTPELLSKRGFTFVQEKFPFQKYLKKDCNATLIGYGGVRKILKKTCKELYISDMRPASFFKNTVIDNSVKMYPEHFTIYSEKDNEKIIKKSDSLIITGSALANNSIEHLLQYGNHCSTIGLYGPSAGIIPDILFENGVNFILSYYIKSFSLFKEMFYNSESVEKSLKRDQIQGYIVKE